MTLLKIFFWIALFIVFYSYVGYGILLWILLKIRKKKPAVSNPTPFEPLVSLIIPAYNEEDFIRQKIENTLALDYPAEKLTVIFVTDGSSDNTPAIIREYPQLHVQHNNDRKGKVAAMNRAILSVNTPFTIFCDANTLLNRECIRNIIRHYADPRIGGVAGEKKVEDLDNPGAAGSGEGIYWKYESWLKKLDSDFYTVVGAAGELFSLRTDLFEHVEENVLLDDFVISLRICKKGYKVAYEPAAYAIEKPSANIKEEKKRKIRISAGGFQSIGMLSELLNVFKYPLLSFQYISHRVLRWAVCPFLLPLIFLANLFLIINNAHSIYIISFWAQVVFYGMAILGWLSGRLNLKIKLLYVPYYFTFMNLSLYQGFFRYLRGNQSVLWDKAKRKS